MIQNSMSFLGLSAMAVLLASTAGAAAAVDAFGGWMLNRETSKLATRATAPETVVIVPWGSSGWVWNQISGGRWQPENFRKGTVKPVEIDGAGADAAERLVPSAREMYYATWDGKTFASHGGNPGEVQLKRVNDQTFEATFFKTPQRPAQGTKSRVAFSPDGQHLTVTTDGEVRIYDRIDPASWPSHAVQPAPAVVAAGSGLPCSGIWNLNEQLTHRTRSPQGPFVQYFGPWGKNGWVRLNTGSLDAPGAELVFNSFNGNAFEVYGGDPREQTARQLDADTFETQAVRNGKPADKSTVQFSNDCKRLTFIASGTDRRTGRSYSNDTRVYDMIEP